MCAVAAFNLVYFWMELHLFLDGNIGLWKVYTRSVLWHVVP